MIDDQALRDHLVYLLRGGGAHIDFESAVSGLPHELRGRRPARMQYTAPTETGEVAAVAADADDDVVTVDANASRAERRRAERANRKRKR